mgnify:CR=1 FL=1
MNNVQRKREKMKKVIIDSLKSYKWKILIQVTLITLNIYLLTIPAEIIGKIVDLLYDIPNNKQVIFNYTYYLLGICLFLLIVRVSWKYYETYIARGFEKDLKDKLFERFQKIKTAKLQKIKNGEIMSYFVKDTNEIRSALYRVLSHGTRIVVTFVIVTITMIRGVNLKLTVATLFPIIITSYIIVKLKNYVEKSFKKSQDQFTLLSEYVQESTDSIRTTKAYSCEGEQLRDFIRKNRKLRSTNNEVDVYSNLLSTTLNICFGLCYGISLLYGSKLVLSNQITIGAFVAFNGYIALFEGPVTWIPPLIARWKRAQISYRRLDKVFELEKEKISIKQKDNLELLNGKIEIKDLTFNYSDCLTPALNNINLNIEQGQTLGIIGTIGSGKTTLMNLITRLYNVERGKIFIDDKDINDIPLEIIRNSICYITQDNFLFSTSLKNNINLFRDEYEDEEIETSTKKALIYEEISNMPKGINTVIGERGTDLSGGQKQRVVLSRAFLKQSSIVILDDTFSALDNKTEEFLLQNIRKLTDKKTCIIISNRISDVKHSDNIIVLDAGEIIEKGTHKELLEQKGKYYSFYKQQSTKKEKSFLD